MYYISYSLENSDLINFSCKFQRLRTIYFIKSFEKNLEIKYIKKLNYNNAKSMM